MVRRKWEWGGREQEEKNINHFYRFGVTLGTFKKVNRSCFV